jgi:Calx-beta domain/Bacterial Ig domain/Bacterial cadherin-like domain
MSNPLSAKWFQSPLKALGRVKGRPHRRSAPTFKPRLDNLEDRTVFDVNVTATAGLAGPTNYLTLKGAFDAINAGTHQGAITIDVVGDTIEVAPAALNSSGGTSSYTSVNIRPIGAPRAINGNVSGGATIKLNGADNVTIDGRIGGTGRNLTVSNSSTTTGSAAIWLSSVAVGNGASNDVIRNLEITAAPANTTTNNSFGIIMSGTSILTTSLGEDNDNNQFIFNRITRAKYGIVTSGNTSTPNLNIAPIVTDNIIGPTSFGVDAIGKTGILMQGDTGAIVSRNTVQFVGGDLANTPASKAQDEVGIAIGTDSWAATSTTAVQGNTYTVTANIIHDIVEELTFSSAGILMGTTAGGSATNNIVANNMIYNIRANGTAGDEVIGIGLSAGNTDKIVYNSISITGDQDPGASASSTQYGSAIRISSAGSATNANLTVANNSIFLDATSNSTTTHFYAISANAAAYSFGSGFENNNNLYINPANTQLRTGGISATTGATTTTEYATLANWKTAFTAPQDSNSIQAIPGYTSATDLHLSNTAPATVDAGIVIPGVTVDFDGQARPFGALPDIGADESYFINPGKLQFSSPTYFATEASTSVTITVTRSGGSNGAVQVDYATVPGGTATGGAVDYINSSGTLSWADADVAPKTFTITVVNDGTLEPTETVNLQLSNVQVASLGAQATAIFSILDSTVLSGTVNVGTGQLFTSLTNTGGLFDSINNNGLNGNLAVNITSDLTGETGTAPLNQWAEVGGSGYTVLLKPSGAARTISGSSPASVALIKLNGADRVTIDGSLSGGTDRSLTINNTNAAGGAVIWIASANASNGANNDTIKNTILTGVYGGNAETTIGIVAGSGTAFGGAADTSNSNNTIQNNLIYRVQNSFFSLGFASSPFDQNWSITNNTFGSTAPGDRNLFRGMFLGNAKDFIISNNTINGIGSFATSTSTMLGIQIFGAVDGGTITGNKISDIKQNNATTPAGAIGLLLGATTTSAPFLVANNSFSDLAGQGSATVGNNGYGIQIAAGAGYKLYNNSVLLNTNQGVNAPSGITAALLVTAGVTASGAIDMQNNIFAVTQTQGTRYGVYSLAAASVFQTSNFNDYFAQNVGFLGSTQTTLAAWQTALGKDANSIAVDPLFVSTSNPADLHVSAASPVIEAGTVLGVTGVVLDIDGQPRDGKADIGADETPLPAVLGGGATLTYTENDPATPIAPALTVSDLNSTTLASATVTLTGFQSSEDVLSFTANAGTMGNIDVVTNSGGVLTLASAGATASLTEWQAALRAVQYSNSSDAPITAARTARFVTNDGYWNSTPLTMNVNVVAVNDLPVAQANSITTNEDKPKAFTVSKFTYTDAEGDALASIKVVSLNLAAGDALTVIIDPDIGPEVVTAGMTITAAQIPTLTYTPAANATGMARSTFDFRVNDAGAGTVAATMTMNVTAFNDAPVAQNSSVTTNEEITKTFSVADFQYADTESDSLVSIKVTSLTLAGGDSLTVNQGAGDVAVTVGMTILDTEIPTIKYTPAANGNGIARSKFNFTVNDADLGTVAATMSINVTPVNDLPVAQPSSVTTNEDTAKAFAVASFSYTDIEGDALSSITITNLALASGDALTVDLGSGAVPVTVGMTLTTAQIPTMRYVPAANAFGSARSTFDYAVNDANLGVSSATMTINVTAVNDAPVAQPSSVTLDEDTSATFTVSDFAYMDVESDSPVSITVGTLNLGSGDTLTVNQGAGPVAVTTGMTITAAQIPTLSYVPSLNGNGAGRSKFDFTVNDVDSGTVAATMAINVTPVNDIPVASSSSVTTAEDKPRAFVVSNFPFNDVEGDALGSIKIVSLNLAAGDTLTVTVDPDLGPINVTTGMTITRDQISTLVYTPAANVSGAARSTFDFTVNDADPGVTSATMTINVTAANDVPVAQPSYISTPLDVAKVFAVSDFLFTDVEGDALVSVTVSNLNLAAGDTLTVNQGAGPVAVVNGMTITAAQIPTLTYTPATGGFGTPRSLFDFTVNDAGLGTVAATMSINTTPASFIQFLSPTFTTGEDGVTTAHVVVTRTPGVGPVGVSFATSNGTAISTAVGTNPKDYTATTQTLSWIADDFTPQTIDIPISDDTLNEGRETINLTLSSPTGNALLGATATAVLSIKPSDAVTVDGTAKVPQATSTDTDGDVITIKLSGKVGTLAIYRNDQDGDGMGPIELIEVSGTLPFLGEAPKATLTITQEKSDGIGNGAVNVGAITGTSLKAIAMGTTDLDGDGIHMTGYVGTITVKDVKGGADILLDAVAPTAKSTVKITTGVIEDNTVIDVKAPIASLTATEIGIGTIIAPSIGTLTTKGSKTPALAGDFKSNLTLSGEGVAAGKPTLKTMSIKGAVSNAVLDVHGAITSITVGSFLNSRLFANYSGGIDGLGMFTAGGDVGTFKVTGKTNAFSKSYVIASNFKNVTLASIDPDNGPAHTKFGVTANDVIKALSVTGSKFKYNAKTGGTQDLAGTDFQVKIV